MSSSEIPAAALKMSRAAFRAPSAARFAAFIAKSFPWYNARACSAFASFAFSAMANSSLLRCRASPASAHLRARLLLSMRFSRHFFCTLIAARSLPDSKHFFTVLKFFLRINSCLCFRASSSFLASISRWIALYLILAFRFDQSIAILKQARL